MFAINGGLGGANGNTAALVALAAANLRARGCEVDVVHLADHRTDISHRIAAADALVVATGTYWDSWSSHLQALLESLTPTEGTSTWLGKPAAVLVTMHSVGGKGVLSRLQGVLSTLGASIPPMSGLVLSLASQLASDSDHADDFWSAQDVDVICHNLVAAIRGEHDYVSWVVDRRDPSRRWL